jgi:hypothetical protein
VLSTKLPAPQAAAVRARAEAAGLPVSAYIELALDALGYLAPIECEAAPPPRAAERRQAMTDPAGLQAAVSQLQRAAAAVERQLARSDELRLAGKLDAVVAGFGALSRRLESIESQSTEHGRALGLVRRQLGELREGFATLGLDGLDPALAPDTAPAAAAAPPRDLLRTLADTQYQRARTDLISRGLRDTELGRALVQEAQAAYGGLWRERVPRYDDDPAYLSRQLDRVLTPTPR